MVAVEPCGCCPHQVCECCEGCAHTCECGTGGTPAQPAGAAGELWPNGQPHPECSESDPCESCWQDQQEEGDAAVLVQRAVSYGEWAEVTA